MKFKTPHHATASAIMLLSSLQALAAIGDVHCDIQHELQSVASGPGRVREYRDAIVFPAAERFHTFLGRERDQNLIPHSRPERHFDDVFTYAVELHRLENSQVTIEVLETDGCRFAPHTDNFFDGFSSTIDFTKPDFRLQAADLMPSRHGKRDRSQRNAISVSIQCRLEFAPPPYSVRAEIAEPSSIGYQGGSVDIDGGLTNNEIPRQAVTSGDGGAPVATDASSD